MADYLYNTDLPQDLPAGSDVLDTDYIYDCISVVVLFHPVGARYSKVRGYHAGGGIGNTNWAALFNGVPASSSTMIYVIAGPGNYTQFGKAWVHRELNDALEAHNMTNAGVLVLQGRGIAYVDRFGQVTH